jgi:hypothetical protein
MHTHVEPDHISLTDRIIEARSGTVSSLVPTYALTIQGPTGVPNDPSQLHLSKITITRIATICDEDQSRDREFRLAQCCTYMTGERLCSSDSNCRCIATLIKVNGLKAYVLLDSESTTVSITHNFACIAKLNVMHLENLIVLQLGTVSSRSIINFGSRASLELGLIKDSDTHLDVVNIDRYDMIISTPFICKHGLLLDFS